ncbi:2-polyprenyl-6-methoxyphenol hydroxylase-like FAD-dependent oxidoreductase [Crossiella equi]|uniref:2-polyprenyl-6-methoxyphenol hydroxylase-like FAD-dependent oxidoreductase n=1 Tax=Crossiella equi TaxID=130796 RepID=A0ABS5AP26_9PSEU|nr:FAD-dependent monooxygenase [Crossiella equi]MBP2478334.1 2-polyprenyl-6-methoxyphenol hydroxylase-like FAD-dependent oxidoreductase [Crossiella equi]
MRADVDVDVVVAGAGPTGLALAGELALAGVRVLVLERRLQPHRESRALTLHPRSVELLDQRGLVEAARAAGPRVPSWHFAGLPTELDFTALDSRHAYTLFIPQARTEALLADWATGLGVTVRRGCSVVDLTQDEDGVTVWFEHAGRARTGVRAAFAVGCDGGRGAVRTLAGIDFPGNAATFSAMLGDFAECADGALERAREHGVLAVALEGGTTRFVVMSPARMRVPASEPVTEEEFRQALVEVTGTDLGVRQPRWLSRFGNATRVAARYREGRVLLAGDAAHIHFPAGGQGLNVGLQDAVNLGWKLAAQVRGWAPAWLLDSYHRERHPVGLAIAENTRVQTLLLQLTLSEEFRAEAGVLRGFLDELLGLPAVNELLAARVSALGVRYQGTGLAGARMPDVRLTAAGGEPTRVAELLRDGRLLLLDRGGEATVPEWADRVRGVAVTAWEDHPELAGISAVLVRPDGHVAWAGESGEWHEALAAWAGAPSGVLR